MARLPPALPARPLGLGRSQADFALITNTSTLSSNPTYTLHVSSLKRNLSDLLTQIEWAKVNDEAARQIAHNAQAFVRDNLLARDVFCYHVVLFREFSQRLVSRVEVLEAGWRK